MGIIGTTVAYLDQKKDIRARRKGPKARLDGVKNKLKADIDGLRKKLTQAGLRFTADSQYGN